MQNTKLSIRRDSIATMPDWSPEQVALVKSQIAPGCTDDELSLFGAVCRRTGLDPFARQIYAIVRGREDRRKMSIQTSIDGLRAIAARSGLYGGSETLWCGPDGEWRDVWLGGDEPPTAAKTTVWRIGSPHPFSGIALWRDYRVTQMDYKTKKWQISDMWAKFGTTMLGKCSEALALRKAFPAEMSGLYTSDEMAQADTPRETVPVVVESPAPEKSAPPPPPAKPPVTQLSREDAIQVIIASGHRIGINDDILDAAFARALKSDVTIPWQDLPDAILVGAAKTRGWNKIVAFCDEIARERNAAATQQTEEPEENLFGDPE